MTKTGDTVDLTIDVARKVLATVDAGLVQGKGNPVAGQMCVEAAVCFALGLPHSDNPPCVGKAVRSYKIRLNDANWSSNEARAKGMRRVAIAQLGSNLIDQRAFADYVIVEGVKRLLPIALRAAASQAKPETAAGILGCIPACEAVTDRDTAQAAARAAREKCRAAAAYAAATAFAATAYAAAADADDTAYAAYAAYAAGADARDKTLSLAADIAVEALQKLGAQGCEWLWLCDEQKAS